MLMNWIFLTLGFLLLFVLVIWWVIDLKKKGKEEQNDFENGNSIK